MCDLEWYKLESKKARNLILLMMRAKYPFCITAGKIFPLTIANFCSLLKTSASYISFLLANRGGGRERERELPNKPVSAWPICTISVRRDASTPQTSIYLILGGATKARSSGCVISE
ncbi:hypothetical protein ALC60_05957 [Trachymyrmex zeteki]|uniref:Uncharacterized protein n=1 Tax=Mycetomoellerius zeteki TaxID=64791 RepID=A0A151X4J8_9HYME|nr:hypothetical protein ALC60_05957 [Trachymyrmex zeteki]